MHNFIDKVTRNYPDNVFDALSRGVQFEQHAANRKGAILVAGYPLPIVRTTTLYSVPHQPFSDAHKQVVEDISKATGAKFNNCMLEVYQPTYKNMRFHSDQALDLVDGSLIAIFSCYDNPHEPCPRKLVIKDKVTNELQEVPMDHNSCIVFDTAFNRRHLHKIVGECKSTWLGMTIRLSKTFVYTKDDKVYITDTNSPLHVASDQERKAFFKLKAAENAQTDFTWAHVPYTLCPLSHYMD